MTGFVDSSLFTWMVLPLLIFVARICDMSLDTLRIIMIGRGRKMLVALYGFVEVCIWLLVARQVIAHLPNPLCFFAYAGGFAAGNYVGVCIEERMAVGFQQVHVVIGPDEEGLIDALKAHHFGLTVVAGKGSVGPVSMISTIVPRAAVAEALSLIKQYSPKAFYSIEDVRGVSQGIFPAVRKNRLARFLGTGKDV